MKLPELIERLQRMQAHLDAQGIDAAGTDVVLWGCTTCDDPNTGTGDELPSVTDIDYDKFEEDEPHVVLIEKAGDP